MTMVVGEDIYPASDFELEWEEDFSGGWDFTNKWQAEHVWNNLSWGNNWIPNNEDQFYVDPTKPPAGVTFNPFSVDGAGNGVITLRKSTTAEQAVCQSRLDVGSQVLTPQPYLSGIASTRGHYSHWQGRLEGFIQIPSGKGLFPAFWSMPFFPDGFWETTSSGIQPEIDVAEWHGHYTEQYFTTLHTNDPGPGSKHHGLDHTTPYDLSTQMARYTFDWNDSQMGFGLDGKYNHVIPTPADFKDPAQRRAIIVNIAIYSNWSHQQIAISEGKGRVSNPESYPSEMKIQSLRSYAGKWTFNTNTSTYDLKTTRPNGGGMYTPKGRIILP